ncbi:MAG: polysaccharide pyruvyl transferase family protein [Thermodesulfobacteriota bacterium]|nr:polysaccharide pyruvyl transferase family protein [Thermodesulfobacteriota bacterium]
MKPLKLFWHDSKTNFGDWLSPVLCERLSGRLVVHAKPNKCDLIAVGSILQRAKHGPFRRRIHVWGSGFIEKRGEIRSHHYYHAVRGHKTANLLKGHQIKTVGDPGLLCDLLFPEYQRMEKQCLLGIVPHYKDQQDTNVHKFADGKSHVRIIDILSPGKSFLREVASCEFILSSSLHGLITADAFGIPNAWIKLSDKVRGQDFKFHDYYSVFGTECPAPLDLTSDISPKSIAELADSYMRPNLSRLREQLLYAFPFPKPKEL